jgi:bleomycin hydrolase
VSHKKLHAGFFALCFLISGGVVAQKDDDNGSKYFISQKVVAATPVKDQANTGTCWSFSTTSLFESQCIKLGIGEIDLSEMFTVRNIYLEKAKNYLMRQGLAQFGEGGLGHDPVRAIASYGAMPEAAYTGLQKGQTSHDHSKMVDSLKQFLDASLKRIPLTPDWQSSFTSILDHFMGVPPKEFDYNGKRYTPKSFAKDVLKFNSSDYVNITSFTHHPYYQSFILEQPDNFSNGAYYNLPLHEMISLVKDAVNNGYSIMWDADVSNPGWASDFGVALFPAKPVAKKLLNPDVDEAPADAKIRQELFENLTTVDDHLMHIVGTEKNKNGKTFFVVKNSWGEIGPYKGYVHVSEPYFTINTVSLVVPKAAISKKLLAKLNMK